MFKVMGLGFAGSLVLGFWGGGDLPKVYRQAFRVYRFLTFLSAHRT